MNDQENNDIDIPIEDLKLMKQVRTRIIEEGYTYFIQSEIGGPIKIGFSRDLQKRFKQIQANCPFKIKLLTITDGSKEKILHYRFQKDRLHGEWFKPSNELLQYIISLMYKSK